MENKCQKDFDIFFDENNSGELKEHVLRASHLYALLNELG
jgi:hypothetical protein